MSKNIINELLAGGAWCRFPFFFIDMTGKFKLAVILAYLLNKQYMHGEWFHCLREDMERELYIEVARGLRSSINQLKKLGLLSVRKEKGRIPTRNQYRVNVDAIEDWHASREVDSYHSGEVDSNLSIERSNLTTLIDKKGNKKRREGSLRGGGFFGNEEISDSITNTVKALRVIVGSKAGSKSIVEYIQHHQISLDFAEWLVSQKDVYNIQSFAGLKRSTKTLLTDFEYKDVFDIREELMDQFPFLAPIKNLNSFAQKTISNHAVLMRAVARIQTSDIPKRGLTWLDAFDRLFDRKNFYLHYIATMEPEFRSFVPKKRQGDAMSVAFNWTNWTRNRFMSRDPFFNEIETSKKFAPVHRKLIVAIEGKLDG